MENNFANSHDSSFFVRIHTWKTS